MKNQIAKRLLLAALLWCSVAGAQDIHFSQFTETPLYRNPALAGIVEGDVRVQSVFRTQWNSIANAYKTASLNAEYKMPIGQADDFITAGMQLFYDKAGTSQLTATQVLPALNFHKSISRERNMYLSLGFMGGLVQRRFDRSKITTNSQYEGSGDGERIAQPQFSYFDGSVGMSLNASFGAEGENDFYIGGAYHHFNKPKNSFFQNSPITLAPKYVFSGGVRFGVSDYSYMTIEADYSRQGSFQEMIGGMLYGLKIGTDPQAPDYTLQGGAFLRWNDAVIPMVKLNYNPFAVALSYDVTISQLKTSSLGRGGFELSLAYIGFLDWDNSSLNAVHCPRF